MITSTKKRRYSDRTGSKLTFTNPRPQCRGQSYCQAPKGYCDRYEELTGRSLRQCPACRQGQMIHQRNLRGVTGPPPAIGLGALVNVDTRDHMLKTLRIMWCAT